MEYISGPSFLMDLGCNMQILICDPNKKDR